MVYANVVDKADKFVPRPPRPNLENHASRDRMKSFAEGRVTLEALTALRVPIVTLIPPRQPSLPIVLLLRTRSRRANLVATQPRVSQQVQPVPCIASGW